MHTKSFQKRRIAALLGGAMLVATPALAQDATAPIVQAPAPQAQPLAQAAPPVVTPPAPAEPASAAPEVASPAAAPANPKASSTTAGADAVPVNAEAAAQADAEQAERAVDRRTAAPRNTRTERTVRTTRTERAAPAATPAPQPEPVAAAPAPQPATPPAATAPATTAAATTEPATATEPAATDTATQQTTQTTEQSSGFPLWAAVIAGVVVLAGIAALLLRRRRAEEEYEPVYVEEAAAPVFVPESYAPIGTVPEPVPMAPANAAALAAAIPAEAAPVAAEEVSVEHADRDDVAALTAADTPGDRPWLEFAMRPVRAGTNVDEALVEIELTVANAGGTAAEDVRISTFMLSAGNDSEMERILVDPAPAGAEPMTIAAGEGMRVDATLTMNRADLVNGSGHTTFQPVIVADARYRLPDGSEGRTSASFLVGTAEGGTIEPIALDRVALSEDVEAQLYREPQRV